MAKVTVRCTPELRGSAVNVPHTESVDGDEKGTVVFSADGTAKVSKTLAEALYEFYPNQIYKR